MTEIIIQKSKKKDKKFDAIIDGKKTVSFAQAGASDYTIHKDPERKHIYIYIYIKRHKGMNENWNDCKTATFYSRSITWNKETLQDSIKDVNKRFNKINIKFIG